MTSIGSESGGVNEAVERVARDSYGRLVAYLAVRAGDVAQAEDALGEAFLAALRSWPSSGLPEKPEAWLMKVAQRRLLDAARQEALMQRHLPQFLDAVEAAEAQAAQDSTFPDDRLKLLLTCAHPALAARIRVPLMLQVVLGLDAARIGSAFLVPATTMGQRLARAKTKIREAKISFNVPEPDEWPARLGAVLEALYAAYGTGWDEAAGSVELEGLTPQLLPENPSGRRGDGLAADIVTLVRLLTQLVPDEPEAWGLLSLVLHCQARRAARYGASGGFVPLAQQEVQSWSEPLIREAESCLQRAFAAGRPGRFQWEAAIQSAHAARRFGGATDWAAVAMLYEALVRVAPTMGARVGRVAAIAEWRGAEIGLQELQLLPLEAARNYQGYWALQAHLLGKLGRYEAARAAYDEAIVRCPDAAVRQYLQERRDGSQH